MRSKLAGGFLVAAALVAVSCAERPSPARSESRSPDGTPPAGSEAPARDAEVDAEIEAAVKAGVARAKFGDNVVSGPYAHANLAVYLVHGEDRIKGKTFLTLEEALAQEKVIVHETGNVNELSIENVSLTEEVYVQSGDIVKGGKQDRVIAYDFIVPAKSGKMPVASFCVEQGRWRQRGGESAVAFSVSTAQLATNALKYAAKKSGSQSDVWREVANAQRKIAANVAVASAAPPAAGGPPRTLPQTAPAQASREQVVQLRDLARPNVQGQTDQVIVTDGANVQQFQIDLGQTFSAAQSGASPTSLQLTLENKNVKEAAGKYFEALEKAIEGRGDVVGFAFAINGEANSADIYASRSLFRKLWPKLLRAAAVEAVAELRKGEDGEEVEEVEHVTAAKLVEDFLARLDEEGEADEVSEKKITKRVRMKTKENERAVLFETFDAASPAPGKAIHRSMLAH